MCYKIKTNSMSLFFVILLLRFLDVSMHGEGSSFVEKPSKIIKEKRPSTSVGFFLLLFQRPLKQRPNGNGNPQICLQKPFDMRFVKKLSAVFLNSPR
jgi:hypothetical protein